MFQRLKNTYSDWKYLFPVFLAFLLPFGINYAVLIILWTLTFFAFDDVKTGMKNVFSNQWSWPIIGFFLLHAGLYFFSFNKHEALTSIEIKLSFLAFPVLFFSASFSDMQIKKIYISFVSGCFLATIICLFRAGFLYLFQDFNAFFYSEFTYFVHPSYFAMYLIFALLVIMLYYQNWLSHLAHLNFKIIVLSLVLLLGIILASSKMGLASALIILPFVFMYQLFYKGSKKTIALLIGFFLISGILFYKFFPGYFERIQTAVSVTFSSRAIDKTETESTAVRILIWEEAVKLIQNNWMLGVTPGDANDRLYQAYEKSGMTGALSKHLNAHNQYLQTFIGTGILGFILLCILTFGAAVRGVMKRHRLLVLFSILMILNFLVESMLQAQAGFIFFVFFLCLLVKDDLSFTGEKPGT